MSLDLRSVSTAAIRREIARRERRALNVWRQYQRVRRLKKTLRLELWDHFGQYPTPAQIQTLEKRCKRRS